MTPATQRNPLGSVWNTNARLGVFDGDSLSCMEVSGDARRLTESGKLFSQVKDSEERTGAILQRVGTDGAAT